MTNTSDPFAGWTMADVGCHWSRELPNGKMVHMSTWSCADRSGYSLTSDFIRVEYDSLEDAKAGYDQLAAYYGHLFTGADALMGPSNDPKDLGESVRIRT